MSTSDIIAVISLVISALALCFDIAIVFNTNKLNKQNETKAKRDKEAAEELAKELRGQEKRMLTHEAVIHFFNMAFCPFSKVPVETIKGHVQSKVQVNAKDTTKSAFNSDENIKTYKQYLSLLEMLSSGLFPENLIEKFAANGKAFAERFRKEYILKLESKQDGEEIETPKLSTVFPNDELKPLEEYLKESNNRIEKDTLYDWNEFEQLMGLKVYNNIRQRIYAFYQGAVNQNGYNYAPKMEPALALLLICLELKYGELYSDKG